MIHIYTDEDVKTSLAVELRSRGHRASNFLEEGTGGFSDPAQLDFAVAHEYTILMHNLGDFNRLYQEWLAEGRNHYGIILSTQEPPGVLVRRCLNLLAALDDMRNRLEWLNRYK